MKITNWDTHYENAQSRKVHHLSWVPVPNKHDGERYAELMSRKDASEIFSAWILILQVASRSQHRGSLLRDNGSPHTPESLALKTRGNVEWFKKALPYLLQIGWLEGVMEDAPSVLPACSQLGGVEQKGTEGTEGKEVGLRPPSTIKTPKEGSLPQGEPNLPSNLAKDPALKKAADAQWLAELKVKYAKLNVDQEIEKARRWAKGKGAKFCRPLVISWLNRTVEGAEELAIDPPKAKIYDSSKIRAEEEERIIKEYNEKYTSKP